MRNTKDIHWYPGHMAKATRAVAGDVALVDVVVEMLDARFPLSSANEALEKLLQSKPRIIVLNKSDVADPAVTDLWVEYFAALGIDAIPMDSVTGDGLGRLMQLVRKAGGPAVSKLVAKGLRPRPYRIMIVGVPNVGKSSLVNRLSRKVVVKTADKAGVTRGKQWLRISADIDLLDTPGILPTRLPDREGALRLAAGGAIKDSLFDPVEVACFLIALMSRDYSEIFVCRYLGKQVMEISTAEELLAAAAKNKGLLAKQGALQTENMARMILADFRQGKIGRISLERPAPSV